VDKQVPNTPDIQKFVADLDRKSVVL